MSLAKERSIITHDSFMMNNNINTLNPISPQSPYSSPDNDHKSSDGSDNQDGQSVINFSNFLMTSTDQSLLSFVPKDDDDDQSYQWHNRNNSRFIGSDYSSCFQTGSDGSYGWLYSDQSTVTTEHSFDESATRDSAAYNKRPNTSESTQALKKQCNVGNGVTSNSKKPKVQKPSVAKDPQSIAAKNRRERISERLKVLQELVPNGSKVDLVTMLEKAISYVKFLQLQVKVLATDDFWPVQGGKAPDISQVRDAIDAILSSSSSSQRDRNSSSK